MEPMLRVECVNCGGRYYVVETHVDLQLPENIKPGEAFPNACPLCEDGRFAVLAEEN